MPQSLANILVHLVFSTKNRQPLIHDSIRADAHGYITGIFKNLSCPSVQTGGTADHVHALFSLSRTATIAEVVEEVKKGSSKWMKTRGVAQFSWLVGYGVFSIGESQRAALVRYIERQEQHHRRVSFQDELRRILDRYGVAYDERYLWD